MTKDEAKNRIQVLIDKFSSQKDYYKSTNYNETETRQDFINPFFVSLGWDLDNTKEQLETYRDVRHEDKIKVNGHTKAPDYSFNINGKRKFFVEAKKPSVSIRENPMPALQVRNYAWNGGLSISILTDFEELAIYDCTRKPKNIENANAKRLKYIYYTDYIKEFDFIWDTFSFESVTNGSVEKYAKNKINFKNAEPVDKEFLKTLEKWREYLAVSIALNNKQLDEEEINFAVQQIIDRIVFLKVCEDRKIETENNLLKTIKSGNYYQNLYAYFQIADQKYNSGLFDFKKDAITKNIVIENKILKKIITELYGKSKEEDADFGFNFAIIPVEILGFAYEQFLGKVIKLNAAHHAEIEEKPEVRKAGGVFYTPEYIVEYIVKQTVGELIDNKTPDEISKIKILDPSCGSGSFLLGAYQYLLDYHLKYYNQIRIRNYELGIKNKELPLTPEGNLSSKEKKRILLNNIFGVDIDTQAVEVTKLSLLLKALEGETDASIQTSLQLFNERVLPTLDDNIKSGNSLIDIDFYETEFDFGVERKIKPFSWEKNYQNIFYRKEPENQITDIKEIASKAKLYAKKAMYYAEELENKINTLNEPENSYSSKSGFDVIISNPPYVYIPEKTTQKYFISKYPNQDYQHDLYLLFLERYEKLLRRNGKLGVIVSNTWLQSVLLKKIRKFLVTNFKWNKFLQISDKVFEQAVVDTHVLLFEKSKDIMDHQIDIETLKKGAFAYSHKIYQSELPQNGDVINITAKDNERQLFEKIKQTTKPLNHYFDVYNGVKPFEKGKGKPAQTEQTMLEKPYIKTNCPQPDKNWSPLLRGSLIHRYQNFWNNNSWILYGEWLAAPRKKEIFDAPEKIMVRQTGDSIIATLVEKGFIARDNLHIAISKNERINLKLILGIINSKLVDFYYTLLNPEKGEALAQVKKQHVEQLPLIDFESGNKELQNQIIKLVDRIIILYKDLSNAKLQSQKDSLLEYIGFSENKINELVYKLYEIKEQSEIDIIEGKNG